MGSYDREQGHRYGNSRFHRDRINEDDVPESKHTIFIRGLPGSMSTDEIKDYFEDKIGPVSFDFVKTSPDNARLFVAVRFETRDDAKNAMTKFADKDLLGFRCDLSWFRDIRRFAEYQKAQGIAPFRGRGGFRGRGSYRGGYRGDFRDRRRDHSRERERSRSRSSRRSSRSRSRSRSRTESERSRSARRSRSRSERRSSSVERRRRSTSHDSVGSKGSAYNKNDRKKSMSPRKREKQRSRRSVSKHSNVSSERIDTTGEKRSPTRSPSPGPVPPVNNPPPPTIKVSIKTTKEDLPEIPIPPIASLYSENVPAPVPAPTPVPPPIGPSVDQLKTSFSIGMDTDEPKIVQKTEDKETILLGEEAAVLRQEKRVVVVNVPANQVSNAHYMKHETQTTTPRGNFRPIDADAQEEPQSKVARYDENYTPSASSQYQINTTPYNSWTPVEKKSNPYVLSSVSPMAQKENGFGYKATKHEDSKFPIQYSLLADIRKFQEHLIYGVKAIQQEESFGNLTLSNLSAAGDEDLANEKKYRREEKLAAMGEIEKERFEIHKRKLENALKGDCNTYTIVSKKLLSKDSSLEKPLRMCLIEIMEDLEKQMVDKIDEYLGI